MGPRHQTIVGILKWIQMGLNQFATGNATNNTEINFINIFQRQNRFITQEFVREKLSWALSSVQANFLSKN